jgi:hypothetical protein
MEELNNTLAESLEEFSIMELEDRLEMADRCNNNCSCPAPQVDKPITAAPEA